jgi:Uncharacterized protein conserved in bacteria (DUF2252)
MRSIEASTQSYERWLRREVDVVEDDIAAKHELMSDDAFTFFRGAYYRWLEAIATWCPGLDAPAVPSVGDLHVENFGTWRDGEGRLVWGVNDFDESESLPYTYDVARLATSAVLATKHADWNASPEEICARIESGYRGRLERGPRPFVLGARHQRLGDMVAAALPAPKAWWKDTWPKGKPEVELPDGALAAVDAVAPQPSWRYAVRRRRAGVGSRGRPRFIAVGDRDGARVAREAKQAAPPAGRWLGRPASPSALELPHLVRARDPFAVRVAGWQARRLAPDCVKLELEHLARMRDATKLLESMGEETANVHAAAGADAIAAVAEDLRRRDRDWLLAAATVLADAAREDHRRFAA